MEEIALGESDCATIDRQRERLEKKVQAKQDPDAKQQLPEQVSDEKDEDAEACFCPSELEDEDVKLEAKPKKRHPDVLETIPEEDFEDM